MLLSKLGKIENGRMIKKTVDSVTPYMVEVGKTLFYHGREGDVVSINGNKVVLDIDGEKYNVYLSECNPGTTGDSKMKDGNYEVTWKEKQGGPEQKRIFPSQQEAERFISHKEKEGSEGARSFGVIVLKAFDSKMKDDFTVPLTVEEIKSLFVSIDPAYARMLSGVVTSKQMAVQRGLEKGLKLSSEGMRFKDSKTNKVEIVENNGLWEVRMDGKLVVSATTKEGAIKEAKKFGLMDWNDSKTKDVSYEVTWKEKQGGPEQKRIFLSKEEADRFVAHKERVDSRSYGVIVLKTLDSKMKDEEEGKKLYRVINSEWNRTHFKEFIGKIYAWPPDGSQVELVKQDSKTKDRNIVNINKERRNLEDAYAQALRDGDKGLAKQYSIRLEELRKEAIEAENKDSYDPTKPKNIAAAKKLSVAQGKAAVGDKKTKDMMSESQVESLCKQAGREFLADNPDGDLDDVAGDIAEAMAFSNPQILEFLKKHFGGSVTRRQAREYLADLI